MNTTLKNLYDIYTSPDRDKDVVVDYLYLSKKEYSELLEAGHVEVNPDMHNGGKGFMKKLATRITAEGKTFFEKTFGNVEEKSDIRTVNETDNILNPTVKENAMPEVNFEFAVIPAVTRKSTARGSKYPFDLMPEPQGENCAYFTVTGKDEIKKVQSALGNANRKWSEPTGAIKISPRTGKEVPVMRPIRKFTCRLHTEGDVITAYIFREM